MQFEAPGASLAKRLLRSGAPLLGFLLAHEPHELRWSDLGADWQDVGVFRVMGRVPMPPRAPAGQDPGEPLLDAAHDVRHVLVSSDEPCMRRDLAPHLIKALDKNARSHPDIGLFELGRVFRARVPELPHQPTALGVLIATSQEPTPDWAGFHWGKAITQGVPSLFATKAAP